MTDQEKLSTAIHLIEELTKAIQNLKQRIFQLEKSFDKQIKGQHELNQNTP